ncbi:unnamed protein product [Strongylus vulgaris]|uniref:Serpin domain-containing protein n=1 Tax=Strongylus vulgaris TaxID=40348 RepID=A0A3P7HZ38_STRVU|nr:unnamed protein product [Strongylus vulgaris]
MRFHQLEECRYNREDEVEVLALPYKDHNYEFVVFLPSERVKFEDFRALLTGEILKRFHMHANKSSVNVIIPKFKLTSEPQVKEMLEHIGINQLFKFSCDLKGVSDRENLYVDDVIHKAVVEVNEEGTEAAAVTAFTMVLGCASMGLPIDFYADRPFVFGIFCGNEPIFIGQYC